MIEIIDNLFCEDQQDKIEKLLINNNNFPYFYSLDTVDDECKKHLPKDRRIGSQSQFCHLLYGDNKVNSPFFDEIFKYFKNKSIQNLTPHRIKVNLLFNNQKNKNKFHTPHFDYPNNLGVSAIYYVSNSDGDTYFFNEEYNGSYPQKLTIYKKVTPKKGRVVLFNSNRFHSSSSPIKFESRCIINMVFLSNV
jgi:hypothetical protein